MTRPRSRRNVEGLAGFSVIDPGGNWIRIFPVAEPVSEPGAAAPETKLARALENAVVLADSHGDLAQAAKILDGALGRDPDAPIVDRVRALAYRVELAFASKDSAGAAELVSALDGVALTDPEREVLSETLAAVEELRRDWM